MNWVLDADIARFFDAVDHDWLIRFVEHRVGDRRVIRLIRKWLKAGVMEDAEVTRPEVITLALAGEHLPALRLRSLGGAVATPPCPGERHPGALCRDIVAGFEHQADAERFQAELRDRLAQFALILHPDKTRLIQFGRRAAEERERAGLGKPETFDFLGFTHICGQSRRGRFLLFRRTRRDRKWAKVREVKEELRRRMHDPIPSQGQWLRQVMAGFFAYHAVPTNLDALAAFRYHIMVLWMHTLTRRSQKDRTGWDRINRLADQWLPRPRILHPRPNQRFAVKHQGGSRMRECRTSCSVRGCPVMGIPTAILEHLGAPNGCTSCMPKT